MSDEPKHPDQPFVVVRNVLRFKENRIVNRLLDAYPGGLNSLFRADDSPEDVEQINQLIGYSFAGFCDLSAVREETKARLEPAADAAWKAHEAKR